MEKETIKTSNCEKENRKLVSVIMPLYNAERYVHRAIESILKQSYSHFELILVDDCPTDNTMNIVNAITDSRIRIIHNEQNKGIAYSRNIGMKMAKGEYIAFMDDDDLASLDRFEKEVDFLEMNPKIDALGGRYCLIDENDSVYQMAADTLVNPKFVKATLMFMDPLGNGSMMFRTNVIRDNPVYFQDNCLGMEDYLFWIDFSRYGAISNIKDVLLYWRCIEGNETTKVLKEKQDMRAEKFFEIQKYAMESVGLNLSDNEYFVLKKMFPEGQWSNKVTKTELAELYKVLKKIIWQADQRELDNAKEISILCRKQFSKRVEYSEIW